MFFITTFAPLEEGAAEVELAGADAGVLLVLPPPPPPQPEANNAIPATVMMRDRFIIHQQD
jgi:hypothetical protein